MLGEAYTVIRREYGNDTASSELMDSIETILDNTDITQSHPSEIKKIIKTTIQSYKQDPKRFKDSLYKVKIAAIKAIEDLELLNQISPLDSNEQKLQSHLLGDFADASKCLYQTDGKQENLTDWYEGWVDAEKLSSQTDIGYRSICYREIDASLEELCKHETDEKELKKLKSKKIETLVQYADMILDKEPIRAIKKYYIASIHSQIEYEKTNDELWIMLATEIEKEIDKNLNLLPPDKRMRTNEIICGTISNFYISTESDSIQDILIAKNIQSGIYAKQYDKEKSARHYTNASNILLKKTIIDKSEHLEILYKAIELRENSSELYQSIGNTEKYIFEISKAGLLCARVCLYETDTKLQKRIGKRAILYISKSLKYIKENKPITGINTNLLETKIPIVENKLNLKNNKSKKSSKKNKKRSETKKGNKKIISIKESENKIFYP